MKLHLPLSLRLSLALSVAAMAAAPSHAAVTSYDITTWSGYQDGVVTVGRTVAEDGTASVNSTYMTLSPKPLWNTEWSIVFSAKGDTLKGSLTLLGLELDSSAGTSGTVGIAEGATMSNGNLTLTTWTHEAGVSGAVDFSGYDNVTFVMSRHSDGTFTFIGYNSNDFTHEIFNWTDDHDQSFNKFYFRGAVFGALGTHSAYDNDGNNVSFASDDDIGSYALTKAGYSLGSVATVNDLVNYYYGEAQHKDLTWAGGENGTWSGASWSDGGAAGNVNFAALDSVTFATEDATVALDAAASADTLSVNADTQIVLDNNLSANSLTVADQKTLTLTGSGSVETTSLSGGAVVVSGSTVIVDDAVSDTTLTVRDGGTVTAQSITGVTATVEKATESTPGSTLGLAGDALGAAGSETVVNGALTLTGDARVTVAGNVTLGSVVNNLTAGDSYAFVSGNDAVNLTFTAGETDLTANGNTHSGIGFGSQGTITVAEGAGLKTSRIFASSDDTSNAHVVVKEGGKLEISGSSSNTMLTLANSGTVTAAAAGADLKIVSDSTLGGTVTVGRDLTVGNNSGFTGTVTAGRNLTAGSTSDFTGTVTVGGNMTAGSNSNYAGTVAVTGNLAAGGTSTYGGKVDVGGLLTFNGGTHEISGKVSANTVAGSSTAVLQGNGTLTIKGVGASSYKSGPSLAGNFTVVKEGASGYTQNFGSGGDNSRFTGSLVVKSGIMNLAEFGQTTQVNLQDINISNNATLRLYAESLSSNHSSYKANVSARSLTVGEGGGELAAFITLAPASDTGEAANLILDGTLRLDGSLTLNQTLLSGALLGSLSGAGDKVTLITGFAYSSLHIGGGAAASLLSATEADKWLTDADGSSYYQFSSDELEAAFGNLDSNAYMMRYYGTETGTSGSLVMVLVPEPTTATLSLLALAGLCARRRRK